jgi:hypothetical protein
MFLYFVLCAKACFHRRVFKKLGYLSYFFAAACKGGPFCRVVLGISVYVLFDLITEMIIGGLSSILFEISQYAPPA